MKNFANWLPVVGYEGLYSVSDGGEVYSHLSNRILKPSPSKGGYLFVFLYSGNKASRKEGYIHTVVMLAFAGKCPKEYEIDHIDRDKTNNRLSNLQYLTHEEHHEKHPTRGPQGERNGASKLTWEKARDIRTSTLGRSQLAEKHGVSLSSINDVVNNLTWRE